MKNKKENKIVPIIGLQWGDEGKGKGVARIASKLSAKDLIVRFQGGNNAGHTICRKGECFVFHLIPSGIFDKAEIHLGAGMVINPGALKEETLTIPKNIPFMNRLSVSPHAVLTLPTHLILDSISEKKKGKQRIGSTGRGISPSYTDLILRRALRVGDILEKNFLEKYTALKEAHQRSLESDFNYKIPKKELREKEEHFFQGIKFLKSIRIENSADLVSRTLAKGNKVIAEGAQGTLLDVRFGHYPFVTSSHTFASGVGTGLGIPPSLIGPSIGIFKAYTTRVGEGPFPTELGGRKSAVWCRDKKMLDEKARFPSIDPNSPDPFEQGIALRQFGHEIGATTGRLRRTGWLDLPLLRHAIKINDCVELVMTKLDVLSGFEKIQVCTAYMQKGKKIEELPFDLTQTEVEPIYKSFPIWEGKLSDYGKKLPEEALSYVKFLEKTLGVKIIYVGTGPEEHHVVERYWK